MSIHMVALLVDRRLRRLFPKVSTDILNGPQGWEPLDRLQVKIATHADAKKMFTYSVVLPPRDLQDGLSEPYAAQIVYEILKELSVCKPSL